jgi:hypothetical protein
MFRRFFGTKLVTFRSFTPPNLGSFMASRTNPATDFTPIFLNRLRRWGTVRLNCSAICPVVNSSMMSCKISFWRWVNGVIQGTGLIRTKLSKIIR